MNIGRIDGFKDFFLRGLKLVFVIMAVHFIFFSRFPAAIWPRLMMNLSKFKIKQIVFFSNVPAMLENVEKQYIAALWKMGF